MHVICFLFDPNVGGPTVRARAVAASLKEQGVETLFAIPNTDGTARGYLECSGFEVVDLGVAKPVLPNKPLRFIWFAATVPYSLFRLSRFIRSVEPDLVHVNGAFDILPALAAKISRVPIVWHLNDMLFGKRLSRALGRLVERIASTVAVSAPTVAAHYSVDEADSVVLPVPVDTKKFSAEPRTLPDRPMLGHIANWNPIKNQADFLSVVEQVTSEGIPANAIMFGKLLDSQKSYWEPLIDRAAHPPLDTVVTIPGFVEDIPTALLGIDLLVITSTSEAGPMVCVEALAAGVPVVSYNVGDVENMLEPHGDSPAGIVVENSDAHALADACCRLLRDAELYASSSRNGIRRVAEAYDATAVAEMTLAAYERTRRT